MNHSVRTIQAIVKSLVKRGGICEQIPNTKAYVVTIGEKLMFFAGEYMPAIPYAYGMIFSKKEYICKILKENNIKVDNNIHCKREGYRIFVTKNRYYNVLARHFPVIVGDGIKTIKEIVSKENLKRINNKNFNILPLKITQRDLNLHKLHLSSILKIKEKIVFHSLVDLDQGARFTNETSKVRKSIHVLAKKILNLFPGLRYISFDLDPKEGIRSIDLLPNPNIFFMMHNGKKKRNGVDVLTDLLIHVN